MDKRQLSGIADKRILFVDGNVYPQMILRALYYSFFSGSFQMFEVFILSLIILIFQSR